MAWMMNLLALILKKNQIQKKIRLVPTSLLLYLRNDYFSTLYVLLTKPLFIVIIHYNLNWQTDKGLESIIRKNFISNYSKNDIFFLVHELIEISWNANFFICPLYYLNWSNLQVVFNNILILHKSWIFMHIKCI